MNPTTRTVPACGSCGATWEYVDYADRCCRCRQCGERKLAGTSFCERCLTLQNEARAEERRERLAEWPKVGLGEWDGPVFAEPPPPLSGPTLDRSMGRYYMDVHQLIEELAATGATPPVVLTCDEEPLPCPDLVAVIEGAWQTNRLLNGQLYRLPDRLRSKLEDVRAALNRVSPTQLVPNHQQIDPDELTEAVEHLKQPR